MPNTSTTGYKLIPSSTPFIDGNALLHIIIASAAAGAGLAVAYGLVLLGTEYGQIGRSAVTKAGGWILGLLAAAFCVGAIVLGIHIMVNPKKSKALKVVPASASSYVPVHHAELPVRKGRAA